MERGQERRTDEPGMGGHASGLVLFFLINKSIVNQCDSWFVFIYTKPFTCGQDHDHKEFGELWVLPVESMGCFMTCFRQWYELQDLWLLSGRKVQQCGL